MTYCLSLLCREGIVFFSDSRTSAGVDNITVHPKMRIYQRTDDRVICILSSGNLSLTQSTVQLVEQDIAENGVDGDRPCLLNRDNLFDTVRYLGEKMREVRQIPGAWLKEDNVSSTMNFLVGGQIGNQTPQIFRVYSPGNSIHASREAPFLQIGEAKYGKPILDRGFHFETPLAEAVRYGILSLDATAKSNVSVGTPFEVFCYETGSLAVRKRALLHEDNPWLLETRKRWQHGLTDLVREMPGLPFDED